MTNQELRLSTLKLINDLSGILMNAENEVSGRYYKRAVMVDTIKALKAYRMLVGAFIKKEKIV